MRNPAIRYLRSGKYRIGVLIWRCPQSHPGPSLLFSRVFVVRKYFVRKRRIDSFEPFSRLGFSRWPVRDARMSCVPTVTGRHIWDVLYTLKRSDRNVEKRYPRTNSNRVRVHGSPFGRFGNSPSPPQSGYLFNDDRWDRPLWRFRNDSLARPETRDVIRDACGGSVRATAGSPKNDLPPPSLNFARPGPELAREHAFDKLLW